MTDKEKIREFLVEIADADGCITQVAKTIEKKILPYIDSLQEEPVIEDLQKTARKYEENRKDWDARSENEVVRRAFVAGAKWQKQQIMKGAVDAFIYKGGIRLKEWPLPEKCGKHLDPVKVIIIKEDKV